MSDLTRIRAWKPLDEKSQVACDIDDPDAVQWDVSYPGMYYSSDTENFKSKHDAEHFCHIVQRVHDAGRLAAKEELRAWLGAPQIHGGPRP